MIVLNLPDLDGELVFEDREAVAASGAQAWSDNLLDTDNPYPTNPIQTIWSEYDQWNYGWWKAAGAYMRQEYPDRF